MTTDATAINSRAREIASTCACAQLRKATRAVTQHYDAALEPSGLKVTQFSLLVALALAGPIPTGILAQELVMDRTTLTRNIDILVRDGMAVVVAGKDRRTKLLQITPTGRGTLSRAVPLWQEAQETIVTRMGKQNWSDLSQKLSAITSLAVMG